MSFFTHTRFNRRHLILVTSCVYLVATIVSWVANQGYVPTISELENLDSACFRTASMLIYVECRGFTGAGLAEFVLNLYWMQLQMALVVIQGILRFWQLGLAELSFVFSGFLMSGLLWLPLLYPFWYFYTRDAY